MALQRHPFIPFVVELKTGKVYAVTGVEQLAVARELWAVVASDGLFRIHSFPAIQSITEAF